MIASLQSLQFQIQTWHNLCVNDYCFCSYSISKVLFLTVILMQRRRPPRPAEARAAAGQWQGGQLPAAGDSAVRCREGAGSYTATLLHHCTATLHYTLVITLLTTHTVISDWQQWASLQVLSSSPSQDRFWTRIGRSGAKLSSSKQWAWSKCERESNSMLILSDRGKAN